MTREPFDWAPALSDDRAQALAHGAQVTLDEANEIAEKAPNDATARALVGIGFALLAVRESIAAAGGDAHGALTSISDAAWELNDARAARNPWRRRAERIRRRVTPTTAAGNEGQAVINEGQDDAGNGAIPAPRARLYSVPNPPKGVPS